MLLPLTTGVSGGATLSVGVLPDHPLAYGLPLSLQLLVADSGATQGVALSAGLRLVLDR